MTSATIRVIDGLYQVGWTTDARDFDPDGQPFDTPRQAIAYANDIERPRLPGGRRDPDLAAGSLGAPGVSRDEDATPIEAPVALASSAPQPAGVEIPFPAPAGTCPGCGGPVPPGRRGQDRKTCSAACRERARYHRAADRARADTSKDVADLTPSRPSIDVPASSSAPVGDPLPALSGTPELNPFPEAQAPGAQSVLGL